ncbi:TBC1 domain family member 30-like isoform X1 [Crassostrea angulata]|uniref:TBC1 domain family member 30-like isoform X1 n=1 Tax=Magallana angulata TaxID=2784310 RepID=UPI0022B1BD6F|nr:TBC1 domain family member 30-like isoform X1 [Crassostrea angulata]XP_052677814.1 TBC1 domain family member 30-like isoform X1 [Crassostrea angulata]
MQHSEMSSIGSLTDLSHHDRKTSIVDDLLCEIYDRWYDGRHDSFESDTFTECSSTSEVYHWHRNSFQLENDNKHSTRILPSVLQTQSVTELRKTVDELQHRINFVSSRLVRQLKRRDRRVAKLQHNSDLVTAILQAASQKRRIDTRIRFSLEPLPGDSAFDQWRDAMKAVARLPHGLPDSFRKKVWLSLADNYIREQCIDWTKTVRFAFNDRSNPDDDSLGIQIVKDLHRTGCSGFSGQENDEDRAVLKRVLLGYARWNKSIGYCQGFNVIAALLLEVMDRKEDDALKVMIYLIDHVLPDGYYAHNLRALSVDMAVFRDLLRVTFPKLSKHLDHLQSAAQDNTTGASYEPPLTNVFTMQWFLTLFATCLPKHIVLRVWDSILLEGSEILLRTALAIWGKLTKRILTASSADEFYSLMGVLTQETMDGRIFNADLLVKFIYACAPIPMQQLPELREKYTYNIRPFTSAGNSNRKAGSMLPSDEDDLDEEDLEAISCFTGIIPTANGANRGKGSDLDPSTADISMVGPGAYGMGGDSNQAVGSSVYLERMCTDIGSLKKQYSKLKQRQTQAHVIIAAASAKQRAKVKALTPHIDPPKAINHLFISKAMLPNVRGSKHRGGKAMMVPHFLQKGQKTSLNKQTVPETEATTESAESPVKIDNSVCDEPRDDQSDKSQEDDKSENVERKNGVEETNQSENVRHEAVSENNDGCKLMEEQKRHCAIEEKDKFEEGKVDGSMECRSGEDTKVERLDRQESVESSDCSVEDVFENGGMRREEAVEPDSDEEDLIREIDDMIQVCSSQLARSMEEEEEEEESENSQGEDLNENSHKHPQRDMRIDLPLRSISQDSTGEDEKCVQQGQNVEKQSRKINCGASPRMITMSQSLSLAQYAQSKRKMSSCSVESNTSKHLTDSDSGSVFSPEESESPRFFPGEKTSPTAGKSVSWSSDVQSPSHSKSTSFAIKKPFNPFPVRHFNENRAKTGIKLGMYKTSTFNQLEKQSKRRTLWSK